MDVQSLRAVVMIIAGLLWRCWHWQWRAMMVLRRWQHTPPPLEPLFLGQGGEVERRMGQTLAPGRLSKLPAPGQAAARGGRATWAMCAGGGVSAARWRGCSRRVPAC